MPRARPMSPRKALRRKAKGAVDVASTLSGYQSQRSQQGVATSKLASGSQRTADGPRRIHRVVNAMGAKAVPAVGSALRVGQEHMQHMLLAGQPRLRLAQNFAVPHSPAASARSASETEPPVDMALLPVDTGGYPCGPQLLDAANPRLSVETAYGGASIWASLSLGRSEIELDLDAVPAEVPTHPAACKAVL